LQEAAVVARCGGLSSGAGAGAERRHGCVCWNELCKLQPWDVEV